MMGELPEGWYRYGVMTRGVSQRTSNLPASPREHGWCAPGDLNVALTGDRKRCAPRLTPCQMLVAFTLSAIKVVTRGSQRHFSSPEHPIRNGPHHHPECPKVAAGRHRGVTSPQPFRHRPDLHESANRNRCPESCLPPERRPKQEQQAGPGKGDKHGEVPVPGELVLAREEEAIEEHEAAVSDEEYERPLISQTRVRSPYHLYRSTFLDDRRACPTGPVTSPAHIRAVSKCRCLRSRAFYLSVLCWMAAFSGRHAERRACCVISVEPANLTTEYNG
jgi:hypothetical protein